MNVWIALIGLGSMGVCGIEVIMFLFKLIRRKPVKKTLLTFFISFVMFVGAFSIPGSNVNTDTLKTKSLLEESTESEDSKTQMLEKKSEVEIAMTSTPEPMAESTPAPIPEPTPTLTPQSTPTPVPTSTPTPEPTSTPVPEPTSTPTAVPTSTPTPVPIKTYSDAETVKKVQTSLNAVGYDCGIPDGIAGKATYAALEAYAAAKGIKLVDGKITDELLEKLDADKKETDARKAAEVVQQSSSPSASDYILNRNTGKFHYPGCKSVKQMKEKNKVYFNGTRDEAIAKGYQPCKNCNP